MSSQGWVGPLIYLQADGPTLTAAAAATMLQPQAKITLPGGFFDRVGKQLLIKASGRISNVVTTPGTARFDVRLDAVIAADSLAMPLNQVAKTNVGWWLEMLLTCKAVGATGNLLMQGIFQSEAFVGSPLPTVGGNGSVMLPFNTAPVVGANFDTSAAHVLDMFFTQTVGTGSMTCHQYGAWDPN